MNANHVLSEVRLAPGFNQPQVNLQLVVNPQVWTEPRLWRVSRTVPFYTRDLSTLRFWDLWGVLERLPWDARGPQRHLLSTLWRHPRIVFYHLLLIMREQLSFLSLFLCRWFGVPSPSGCKILFVLNIVTMSLNTSVFIYPAWNSEYGKTRETYPPSSLWLPSASAHVLSVAGASCMLTPATGFPSHWVCSKILVFHWAVLFPCSALGQVRAREPARGCQSDAPLLGHHPFQSLWVRRRSITAS